MTGAWDCSTWSEEWRHSSKFLLYNRTLRQAMVSQGPKLNKTTTSKFELITAPFLATTDADVDDKWYENGPNKIRINQKISSIQAEPLKNYRKNKRAKSRIWWQRKEVAGLLWLCLRNASNLHIRIWETVSWGCHLKVFTLPCGTPKFETNQKYPRLMTDCTRGASY